MVQINTSNGYEDYYFKKIKPGESVMASEGKFIDEKNSTYSYLYSSYPNNIANHYSKHKSGDIAIGLLLGNIYRGFNQTVRRKAVMDYIEDEYYPTNNSVLVVAFPKSDIGSKVLEGKKSKTSRTEAIIIDVSYSDLQIIP